MLARRYRPEDGHSRVAIIMNGSPLFTGDAGSGESEIRRWILENDWLEAVIALPEQLFYNTGIATYIWILSNQKPPQRQGQVQLIDASSFWESRRKSLGDKRRDITDVHVARIVQLYLSFAEGPYVRIFGSTDFGFRRITVERPLQLNFQASPKRIARLEDQSAFKNLSRSTKADPKQKQVEEAAGRQYQDSVRTMLLTLPKQLFTARPAFLQALDQATNACNVRLTGPVRSAIVTALGERDETAEICRDANGQPEPDPELRDTERVPLKEDVQAYFDREVRPYVPDAWISVNFHLLMYQRF